MRIDEISKHNRVIAFLTDIDVDYQPAWLKVKNLLDYHVISGDPVDPLLIQACNELQGNLSQIANYEFDLGDPDLPRLLSEVGEIANTLGQYRKTLRF